MNNDDQKWKDLDDNLNTVAKEIGKIEDNQTHMLMESVMEQGSLILALQRKLSALQLSYLDLEQKLTSILANQITKDYLATPEPFLDTLEVKVDDDKSSK